MDAEEVDLLTINIEKDRHKFFEYMVIKPKIII